MLGFLFSNFNLFENVIQWFVFLINRTFYQVIITNFTCFHEMSGLNDVYLHN